MVAGCARRSEHVRSPAAVASRAIGFAHLDTAPACQGSAPAGERGRPLVPSGPDGQVAVTSGGYPPGVRRVRAADLDWPAPRNLGWRGCRSRRGWMAGPGGRRGWVMDSRVRTIVAAAVVGVAMMAGGSAAARIGAGAASLGSHVWGTAKEVPGTAALNRDGDAGIVSVSCASAGNCSSGGSYTDSSARHQAFVVSQIGGTWGTAIEVPGTAALNQGGFAVISSVSCGAAGNCSAGGSYATGPGHRQAFVASEKNGTWHKAIEVPGTAALNRGRIAAIFS